MPKRWISLCVSIAIAIASVPPSSSADKDTDSMAVINQLGDAKKNAVRLVQEIMGSQPSDDDKKLLGKYYKYAKDSYLDWSQEAADAVQHHKQIDLRSAKASEAHSRLKELSKFARDYQEKRTREEKERKVVTSE